MAKRIKGKALYPPPVACATFARGETIRMSFYQIAGKPWRFDAAKGMLAQVIGNERARALDPRLSGKWLGKRGTAGHLPASDFVSFHVEHDGQRYEMPASNVVPLRRKPKVAVEPQNSPVVYIEDTAACSLLEKLVATQGMGFGRKRATRAIIAEARRLLAARAAA